ncbi:sugar ABC transporter ATP-binding protein [Mycolicibacterium sp.]|uniref:sugar ABC transporter ATP-binding protein n=1 Tax=Mycolicibacterium sp. TaxID=2320850 RepID=UPI0037C54F44
MNDTDRPGRDVVRVQNAVKRFGATTALDDLSMVVHRGESRALVGRNGAGKSTLVSVLTGLQALDSGHVLFDGQPAPALTQRRAWMSRVSCVYQHRTLVPELSVAENLFLGHHQTRGLIKWRSMQEKAQREFDRWGIAISARDKVGDLGVGEAQMVEIVRALASGSQLIILDEPTAQLVASEIDALISQINVLREQGVTFLFISHHLDEIPRVCDTVTVLRNGTDVLHGRVEELTTADMVQAMVGFDTPIDLSPSSRRVGSSILAQAPVVLDVDDVTIPGQVEAFSLSIRAGEVVGLAGHAGSGARQIAMSIAGHRSDWTGSMRLGERSIAPKHWDNATAVHSGVTLVPEDRIKSGLVGSLSIEDNLTLTTLRQLSGPLLLDGKKRRLVAEVASRELGVRCASVRQPVGQLSGGNQQKVLLGSALRPNPKVLVLMHPTAGVDIASKATIMQIVEDHCAKGLAVILVSDEPEELAFCDRVQVWVRGQLALEGQKLSKSDLIAAMEGSLSESLSTTVVSEIRTGPKSTVNEEVGQ